MASAKMRVAGQNAAPYHTSVAEMLLLSNARWLRWALCSVDNLEYLMIARISVSESTARPSLLY